MVVGMAIQVVAVDSKSTGHHHTLDRAPALVLGHGRAAVVSIRFPEEHRQTEAHQFTLNIGFCSFYISIHFKGGINGPILTLN